MTKREIIPMFKYFDSHVHLNDPQLSEYIGKNHPSFFFNCVGTTLKDSVIASELSVKHYNVFATIGVHPLSVWLQEWECAEKNFKKLLKCNKVIAIGETGLDFYRAEGEERMSRQYEWLGHHITLAKQHNLPLVLHVREAYAEILEILKKEGWFGIIHSYDGGLEFLDDFLKLEGWMLSISPLFFRRPKLFIKVVKKIPLNRLLVETDSPWLAKDPHAVLELVNALSETLNVPHVELKSVIWENCLNIFGLKRQTFS